MFNVRFAHPLPKGPVTLSRNEAEPAGMNNFQHSSHIRAGMSCKRINFFKESRSKNKNSLRTRIE